MKRVKPAKKLSDIDAAYLAGIVDGEGCITASLNRGYINGRLEIGSVNREFLQSLVDRVGTGTFCAAGRRSKNAKILYRWHIQLGAMPSLLPQLLPYLKLKKAQAEMMLALVRYSSCPSVVNLTDSFQIETLNNFRRLNQRGEAILSN